LNTYKATYTTIAVTLSTELGHSKMFFKNNRENNREKRVIPLPRDVERLEIETEDLLLCVHI